MTFLFLVFNLLFISTSIAETILEGNLIQGGLIFGTTTPGNSVMLENRNVRVSSNGFFVFGFSRDAKESFKLIIKGKDSSSEVRSLRIKRRKYVVQRINGLSNKMVHPSQKVQGRIRDEIHVEIQEIYGKKNTVKIAVFKAEYAMKFTSKFIIKIYGKHHKFKITVFTAEFTAKCRKITRKNSPKKS